MTWVMKQFQSPRFWTVPQEWAGQTAFIIAGGPSVLQQNLELIRGRNVIAINSSIHAAPWAKFVYFGDWRWWNASENNAAVAAFQGRVVTTSLLVRNDRVLLCRRANPPGLALERDCLMQKWTSLTAATNLAAHLVGPGGTIVWLGADGRYRADGRTHHHKPHEWPRKDDCFDKQLIDLITIVPSLQKLNIAAFNASPGTAWCDLLPVVDLRDMVGERQAA
jgi:hypothetical protein